MPGFCLTRGALWSADRVSVVKTYNRLPARLRAFVRAYVETGVGTKAMRAIKFEGRRPEIAASKLRAKPKVREAIAEFEASMQDEVKCRVYRALRRLELIAEFDPRELVGPDGLPVALKDLPDEVAMAIQGIEVEELFEGRGEARERVGRVHKYKAAGKIEANRLIMQYQRVLVDVKQHQQLDENGQPTRPGPTFIIEREEAKTIAKDLDQKV